MSQFIERIVISNQFSQLLIMYLQISFFKFYPLNNYQNKEYLALKMQSQSQNADQRLYSDYVQALQRQSQQSQIESRTMQNQLSIIQCHLEESLQQKQLLTLQLKELIVKVSQQDKYIQIMEVNQIEAENIIQNKNQQIQRMDQYFTNESVKLQQEKVTLKEKIDLSQMEKKILSDNLQKIEQKNANYKISRVYDQVICFQEDRFRNTISLKQHLQNREIQNSKTRANILQTLNTLKEQQNYIKQMLTKFDDLTFLLKQKEGEIKTLKLSNQHLSNLNQSLIITNIQHMEQAKRINEEKSKHMKKNYQETTRIALEEDNFEIESEFKIQKRRRSKNINNKSFESELLIPIERHA